ncbi:MAG: MgtC/SapB transporter [Parcubacteria group bacterium GW2011_GWA2_50_10b]|nr:MAG: MgtC/SapB transporter [Parcubacteria group bacterium GW2011_GWA2_50_10b]
MLNFTNFDISLEPFVYLVAALILGSILGIERTLAHKTAGVRTYSLVSMGSCLFILIARYVIPTVESFNYDPMRMAAGVVMGVGFLCGGVIIFKDSSLVGLTTAAGLWVAAGIGMAVGYGLLGLAVLATVSTLLVFTLFWFIEQKIISRR